MAFTRTPGLQYRQGFGNNSTFFPVNDAVCCRDPNTVFIPDEKGKHIVLPFVDFMGGVKLRKISALV